MQKGKVIVIEGTDCSGKETQSKLLEEKLKKKGKKCKRFSFPMYDTPTGKIVGGSYLGSKAIIEMFSNYFKKEKVEIIFAGFSLSSTYLKELLDYIKDKEVIVNVISKSGTTLEPNITFNAVYGIMKKKYNKTQLQKRIIITTDKKKGKLRKET